LTPVEEVGVQKWTASDRRNDEPEVVVTLNKPETGCVAKVFNGFGQEVGETGMGQRGQR